MSLLLLGKHGQVGRELVRQCPGALALGRDELDISDPSQVESVLARHRPTLVINATAYTAVDQAEAEPERARAANRDGPAHLARVCSRLGAALMHLSTDYVFGEAPGRAHRETDAPSPLNLYGHTKWEGEQAVTRLLERHFIVRVSWVFGEHGKNFFHTVMRLGRAGGPLRIVADERSCPTPVQGLVERLLLLSRTEAYGTYHCAGSPAVSRAEFARAILDAAGMAEVEIDPVPSSAFPTPARRPLWSELDDNKLRALLQLPPLDWRASLPAVLARLASP